MVYPSGYPVMPDPLSGLYSRGELVNVYPREKIGDAVPNANSRLCFIHITDCPHEFGVVKNGLMEQWREEETPIGRGVWIANVEGFLAAYPAKYTELQTTKITTLTWGDVEAYMISKRTGNTLGVDGLGDFT